MNLKQQAILLDHELIRTISYYLQSNQRLIELAK